MPRRNIGPVGDNWDEHEHPRHPRGTPGGRGGEFRDTHGGIEDLVGGLRSATTGPWQQRVSDQVGARAGHPRERYNQQIVAAGRAQHAENQTDGFNDPELGRLVTAADAAGITPEESDTRVDALRQRLESSYSEHHGMGLPAPVEPRGGAGAVRDPGQDAANRQTLLDAEAAQRNIKANTGDPDDRLQILIDRLRNYQAQTGTRLNRVEQDRTAGELRDYMATEMDPVASVAPARAPTAARQPDWAARVDQQIAPGGIDQALEYGHALAETATNIQDMADAGDDVEFDRRISTLDNALGMRDQVSIRAAADSLYDYIATRHPEYVDDPDGGVATPPWRRPEGVVPGGVSGLPPIHVTDRAAQVGGLVNVIQSNPPGTFEIETNTPGQYARVMDVRQEHGSYWFTDENGRQVARDFHQVVRYREHNPDAVLGPDAANRHGTAEALVGAFQRGEQISVWNDVTNAWLQVDHAEIHPSGQAVIIYRMQGGQGTIGLPAIPRSQMMDWRAESGGRQQTTIPGNWSEVLPGFNGDAVRNTLDAGMPILVRDNADHQMHEVVRYERIDNETARLHYRDGSYMTINPVDENLDIQMPSYGPDPRQHNTMATSDQLDLMSDRDLHDLLAEYDSHNDAILQGYTPGQSGYRERAIAVLRAGDIANPAREAQLGHAQDRRREEFNQEIMRQAAMYSDWYRNHGTAQEPDGFDQFLALEREAEHMHGLGQTGPEYNRTIDELAQSILDADLAYDSPRIFGTHTPTPIWDAETGRAHGLEHQDWVTRLGNAAGRTGPGGGPDTADVEDTPSVMYDRFTSGTLITVWDAQLGGWARVNSIEPEPGGRGWTIQYGDLVGGTMRSLGPVELIAWREGTTPNVGLGGTPDPNRVHRGTNEDLAAVVAGIRTGSTHRVAMWDQNSGHWVHALNANVGLSVVFDIVDEQGNPSQLYTQRDGRAEWRIVGMRGSLDNPVSGRSPIPERFNASDYRSPTRIGQPVQEGMDDREATAAEILTAVNASPYRYGGVWVRHPTTRQWMRVTGGNGPGQHSSGGVHADQVHFATGSDTAIDDLYFNPDQQVEFRYGDDLESRPRTDTANTDYGYQYAARGALADHIEELLQQPGGLWIRVGPDANNDWRQVTHVGIDGEDREFYDPDGNLISSGYVNDQVYYAVGGPPAPVDDAVLPFGATTLAEVFEGASSEGQADRNGRAAVERLLREMWQFDDPRSGLRTRVTNAGYAGYDSASIQGVIEDADGNQVGTFTRNISGTTVDHAYFKLTATDRQGGGLSTRWLEEMKRRYREQGLTHITIYADIDVGGYAWAKAGFDFESPSRGEGMIRDLYQQIDRGLREGISQETEDEVRELFRRVERGHEPTPLEIAMLGWRQRDQDQFPGFPRASANGDMIEMWLGKDYLLGKSWNGVFTL